MIRSATMLIASFLLMAGSAQAACPSPVPGDTAAEIAANGQRIVCLQNEVAAAADQRALQAQLDALRRSQQEILLQQRLDRLPPVPVFEPPAMITTPRI